MKPSITIIATKTTKTKQKNTTTIRARGSVYKMSKRIQRLEERAEERGRKTGALLPKKSFSCQFGDFEPN